MFRLMTLRARWTRTQLLVLALLLPPVAWIVELALIRHLGWSRATPLQSYLHWPPTPAVVAAGAWVLIAGWTLLACFAARLRDSGRSGWWALLPAAAVPGAILLPLPLWPAAAGVLLAAWMLLMLLPGSIGANQFGDDPRGWESRDQFDAVFARLTEEMRVAASPRPYG